MPRKRKAKARKAMRRRRRGRKGGGGFLHKAANVIKTLATIGSTFPSELKTIMKSIMNMGGAFHIPVGGNAPAGNAQIWYWRGNGIIATGPGGIWPLGSTPIPEAANFPAGINYLLSQEPLGPVGTPTAPYNKYLVTRSDIRLRLIPLNVPATESVNTVPLQCVLVPLTLEQSAAGTTFDPTTLSEQPHAKKWIVPATLTGEPICLKHHITTSEALGGRPINTALPNYYGTYNTNPVESFDWVLMVCNVDGMAWNIAYDLQVECDYHTTFFDRNVFSNFAPVQAEYASNGNYYYFDSKQYQGQQVAGGTLYDAAGNGPSGPIIQTIYLGTAGASGPSGPFGYYARGNFNTTYVGT